MAPIGGEDDGLEDLKTQEEILAEAGAGASDKPKDDGPTDYLLVEEDGTEPEGEEAEAAAPAKKAPPTAAELELRALKAELNELKGNMQAGENQRSKELDARIARVEKADEDELVARFNARRDQVKANLRKAKEDGDIDKEMEATDLLTKMNAAEMVYNSKKKDEAERRPAPQQRQQAQAPRPPVSNEANAWYMRNRGWFGTKEHQQQTAYTRAVDVQLEAEGFDKNSTAYFDELDKRVAKQYPTTVIPRQGAQPMKKPNGSSTAQTGRSGGSVPRSGDVRTPDGRLKLTPKRYQVANMLGILDDPRKIKAYEKEIKRSSSGSAR